MEIKTVSSRMYSLVSLYDIHTKYFSNVLEGITDEDAHKRMDTKANHIAWIAGSLVYERYDMAKMFGSELKFGAYELFRDFKGIQDNTTYPTLSDYKKEWETITPVLRNLLCNIDDAKLDSVFEMPEMKMTYYEMLTYLAHREAYCIGQIGLWRRLLGYGAMKYS